MTDAPRLTLADCHAMQPRLCNKGLREWCAKHGLEWSQLRDQGLLLSDLERIDDALMQEVIETQTKPRLGIK